MLLEERKVHKLKTFDKAQQCKRAPKVSKGRSESPLVASAEAKPLRNTRKQYENARNSIARKGVQRVEDPLAESRGSASGETR